MTYVEAFNAIEAAAGALRLKDAQGQLLSDLEALSVASAPVDTEWQELAGRLVSKAITPREYADRALALIDGVGRQLLIRRLETRLAELAADQRELGLK